MDAQPIHTTTAQAETSVANPTVRERVTTAVKRVKLSTRATRAIVRWDRERERAFGPASGDAPLFITLGRRRRDGTYTRVGGRCGQPVLADLLKRLGAAAELPAELRHPHALRHTCATVLLRAGATVADVRVFLGHASVTTTQINQSFRISLLLGLLCGFSEQILTTRVAKQASSFLEFSK